MKTPVLILFSLATLLGAPAFAAAKSDCTTCLPAPAGAAKPCPPASGATTEMDASKPAAPRQPTRTPPASLLK